MGVTFPHHDSLKTRRAQTPQKKPCALVRSHFGKGLELHHRGFDSGARLLVLAGLLDVEFIGLRGERRTRRDDSRGHGEIAGRGRTRDPELHTQIASLAGMQRDELSLCKLEAHWIREIDVNLKYFALRGAISDGVHHRN